MEDPYQRAICLKLLTLVAENITLKFSKFEYEPPLNSLNSLNSSNSLNNLQSQQLSNIQLNTTFIPIPIRQSIYKVPFEEQSTHDQTLIRNLETVITAAEDIKLAKELFRKFDTDNSGALDIDELNVLVKHFSPAIEEAALQEVFFHFHIFFLFLFFFHFFFILLNQIKLN